MKNNEFRKWADKEIALAREDLRKSDESTNIKKDIAHHRRSVIDIAERIFNQLILEDEAGIESFAAINMVKNLLDREPLTPVTDEFDQWKYDELYSKVISTPSCIRAAYTHVRNPGLMKIVSADGVVRNTEIDRVSYADLASDDPDNYNCRNGFVTQLIDTIYHPITFPYVSETVRVKVYKFDGKEYRNDLPSIMHVVSFSVNDGPFEKIDRYYRYDESTTSWNEIGQFVYYNHKNVIETTKKLYDEYDTTKKGCPCYEE